MPAREAVQGSETHAGLAQWPGRFTSRNSPPRQWPEWLTLTQAETPIRSNSSKCDTVGTTRWSLMCWPKKLEFGGF